MSGVKMSGKSRPEFEVLAAAIDALADAIDELARTRNSLSESRELLARAETLVSARSASRKEERSSQGHMLPKAIKRAFDRLIDQKASPLPRSTSFH